MALLSTHTRPSLLTPHPSRSAITLVEMLISMAVTLLMMAAVVNLFANIGEGVRNRRASMELGSELRLARARLFKDLAGVTCPVRPKLPSDDHDDGYFEIIEGNWSDENPSILLNGVDDGITSTDPELDYTTSIIPSAGDPRLIVDTNRTDVRTPNANDVTNGGGLGDYDDILALTVRSESEPFVGKCWLLQPGTNPNDPSNYYQHTIESDLAEIIWYAVENPRDGSLGEPGMRTVYRRVLLIAPSLQGRLQFPLDPQTPAGVPIKLLSFYRENDISVRVEDTNPDPNIVNYVFVPNTLSDLTLRENRFGHYFDPTVALAGFPHPMVTADTIRALSYSTPPDASFGPMRPKGDRFDEFGTEEVQGEDVMLNDVLAFDIRVFDPGAPLSEYPLGSGIVIEPSAAPFYRTAVRAQNPVGYGTFVDLGWDNSYDYPAVGGVRLAIAPDTPFQEEHAVGWHPRASNLLRVNPSVYDTWPYTYEDDGLDQDNRDNDNNVLTGVDEGTNGLDDPDPSLGGDLLFVDNPLDVPILGTDDPGERETAPPYDVPLRAVQIKLRVYERDTRQIRESTVTKNFVPQ